jgi:HK97 gp10 family phage protein
MSVEFKTDGFEDLFKRMDELKEEIGKGKTDKIWRTAMKYAMEPVLQDAKAFAPVNTGQTKDKIYLKVQRPQSRDKESKTFQGEMYIARVTVSALREDSVQNFIINKKGKFQTVWSNKSRAPVSQEFGNARTPAHPFLRPALENNLQRVESRLGWSIWQQIEEKTKKG